MSHVIVLGAGASKGTLEGKAPVAADFGEYLYGQDNGWQKQYPYLHAVIKYLRFKEDNWPLDKVWGAIDNTAKLQYVLGQELPGAPFPPPQTLDKEYYKLNMSPWGYAGHELRCAVTRVYGDFLSDGISSAANADPGGTLKQELRKLKCSDCLVSFNYDLLAEEMLKKLGTEFVRSAPHTNSVHNTEKVLLCKPHGCLSWKQQVPEKRKAVEILERAMTQAEIDWDPQRQAHVQPGIIGPVSFKSEIIMPELQRNNVDHFFALLVQQWRDALQRIKEADELIVIGYGFPSEDLHATYMFADAAARRTNASRLHIKIYEVTEQRFCEVKANMEKIFAPSWVKKEIGFKYCGKVEP